MILTISGSQVLRLKEGHLKFTLHHVLSQEIEYSSLFCTVEPQCLSKYSSLHLPIPNTINQLYTNKNFKKRKKIVQGHTGKKNQEFPVVAQQVKNPVSIHEDAGSIPGLNQQVKDLALPQAAVQVREVAWIQRDCVCSVGQQLQLQFYPQSGNFHIPRVRPSKKFFLLLNGEERFCMLHADFSRVTTQHYRKVPCKEKSSFSFKTGLNKKQGTYQICVGKGQDSVKINL